MAVMVMALVTMAATVEAMVTVMAAVQWCQRGWLMCWQLGDKDNNNNNNNTTTT